MSARMKVTTQSWSHTTNSWSLRRAEEGWLEGYVATEHGFVRVTAPPLGDECPETSLTFIWRGRMYYREYNRVLTVRGAVRVAARFARDIAGGRT